eukprot:s4492_g4.t1
MARRGLLVLSLAIVGALRSAFVGGLLTQLGAVSSRGALTAAAGRDITPLGNQVLVEELDEPEVALKPWDPESLETCATLSRGKRNPGIIWDHFQKNSCDDV